jgi:hypothetical protein
MDCKVKTIFFKGRYADIQNYTTRDAILYRGEHRVSTIFLFSYHNFSLRTV